MMTQRHARAGDESQVTAERLRIEAARFRRMHDGGQQPWVSDASWVADDLDAAASEIERLRAVIRAVLDAPVPPGKHTTTGGVVFVSLAAMSRLQEALAHG